MNTTAKVHLLNLTSDELRESLAMQFDHQVPAYRADQILEWIYRHRVDDFDGMNNLPKELRAALAQRYTISTARIVADRHASDGTRKWLLSWPEGGTTECVMIPSDDRMTACISTQVGCPVKCAFCASGVDGLERNLSVGEIVEQAWCVAAMCEMNQKQTSQGVAGLTNVVFMGLGEPLVNYANTIKAIRIINAPWGIGLGARRITISTVGLPSQIRKLAEENLQINLALSLHAPADELRRELIPWAERVTIAQLVEACRYYFDQTGREVTLEYILLEGVNNLPKHAHELADICRSLRSNVNLIAYNPVKDLGFDRPSDESIHRFLNILRHEGVNAHVRTSRGLDIDAACGQLRRRQKTSVALSNLMED